VLPPKEKQNEIRYAHQYGQDALLINAGDLAKLLDRSETALRRDDKAGRIPRSIALGGAKKWRIAEIRLWVEAGCPRRSIWETRYRPSGPVKVG
jgi:hypothetical protein